jgi:hypothetical protein
MRKFGTNNTHYGLTEVLKETTDVGLTFGVVRNPYDYVVSLHKFFCTVFTKWQSIDPDREWGFDTSWIDPELPFDVFVERLPEWSAPFPPGYTLVSQQYDFLCPGVNMVLRYETLDEDFMAIQDYLKFHIPLGHHNKSDRGIYQHYYNDHLKSLVAGYFAEDIDRFGYRYED